MIAIGIDPGAKYTGVSVRDGMNVLLSSTYVRPEDTPHVSWAVEVASKIQQDVIANYPDAIIGIEGVTVPNAYNQGKLNLMSPKYIIWTALIVGAVSVNNPNAVIVRPGKNGSQDLSSYPPELSGRRPKDLLGESKGAGTRNHEKSAFDVAGEAVIYHNEGRVLDEGPR